MDDTIYTCDSCGQPLIERGFNRAYRLRVCNNVNCRLYAERQGLRELSEEEGEAYRQRRQLRIFMAATGGDRRYKELSPDRRMDMDRRKARPGYKGWLAQKKENYRTLRDLGYGCQEALANSSKKRMRELGVGAT